MLLSEFSSFADAHRLVALHQDQLVAELRHARDSGPQISRRPGRREARVPAFFGDEARLVLGANEAYVGFLVLVGRRLDRAAQQELGGRGKRVFRPGAAFSAVPEF